MGKSPSAATSYGETFQLSLWRESRETKPPAAAAAAARRHVELR